MRDNISKQSADEIYGFNDDGLFDEGEVQKENEDDEISPAQVDTTIASPPSTATDTTAP